MDKQKRIGHITVKNAVIISIIVLLFFTNNLLVSIPKLNSHIYSYDIDKSGNLFLGKNSLVEIYKDCILINEFIPPTNRGYRFKIQDDETILFATGNKIITLDSNYNVVSKNNDDSKLYMNIPNKYAIVTGADGNQYKLKSTLGYQRIYRLKDGKEIYTENLNIYLLSVLHIISCVLFSILVICVIYFTIKFKLSK